MLTRGTCVKKDIGTKTKNFFEDCSGTLLTYVGSHGKIWSWGVTLLHLGKRTNAMYVNLTPHDVHIWEGDSIVRTYPRSGNVARCAVESIRMYQDSEGNDVYATRMGAVTDLPEEELDVFLIVSSMVANHPDLAHRVDLVCPFTPVLDDKGRTVGCRSLCMPNAKWIWESYPANFEE